MPEQYFTNVTIKLPEELYDVAYVVLSDFPVQGIEEKIDELMICFGSDDWNQTTIQELQDGFATYSLPFEIIKEEQILQKNWNEQWEQSLEPIVVSPRITISPEWALDKVQSPITIIINPKMSFGTGYHPTTRMTTRFVEKYTQQDSVWTDIGTGTGVLAIAAVKCGASSCLALDNDVWSVENTQENIERNSVQKHISVYEADIFTYQLPTSNGIAANLYRNVLIPNFEKMYNALTNSGVLIISGVLKYDSDEIIDEAKKVGFTFTELEQEDEWVAIVFHKNV